MAGSILMSSCSPQNILNYEDIEQANSNQIQRVSKRSQRSIDELSSSCLLPLSEQDKQLINLCINLTNDILHNREVAAQFSGNPQLYLAEKGYTYAGDFNSGLIQLALAASDEDIRQSIENQDAKSFVSLCIQKGLLSIPSNLEITRDENGQFADEEQLKEFLYSHGYNLLDDDNSSLKENDVEVAVEAVALLYVAGVVVVAALVAVGLAVIVCGEDGELPDKQQGIPMSIETSPLTLWLFNSNDNTIVAPINTWVETLFNQIDEILMENYPAYATDTAYREQLQKIITANILNYIIL